MRPPGLDLPRVLEGIIKEGDNLLINEATQAYNQTEKERQAREWQETREFAGRCVRAFYDYLGYRPEHVEAIFRNRALLYREGLEFVCTYSYGNVEMRLKKECGCSDNPECEALSDVIYDLSSLGKALHSAPNCMKFSGPKNTPVQSDLDEFRRVMRNILQLEEVLS